MNRNISIDWHVIFNKWFVRASERASERAIIIIISHLNKFNLKKKIFFIPSSRFTNEQQTISCVSFNHDAVILLFMDVKKEKKKWKTLQP